MSVWELIQGPDKDPLHGISACVALIYWKYCCWILKCNKSYYILYICDFVFFIYKLVFMFFSNSCCSFYLSLSYSVYYAETPQLAVGFGMFADMLCNLSGILNESNITAIKPVQIFSIY